jgi:hypothetical protein
VRKRLLIGAIAAVVIGVATYFLSQPNEGTVEWHKKEYLKAFARLQGKTMGDTFRRVYYRLTRGAVPSRAPNPNAFRENSAALLHHANCLVRLGYLAESRVVVTNSPAITLMSAGHRGRYADDVIRDFILLSAEGPGTVGIIAPPSDLPKIEAAIRQFDVQTSE